jgi:mono/diheme cytochrome c family protein
MRAAACLPATKAALVFSMLLGRSTRRNRSWHWLSAVWLTAAGVLAAGAALAAVDLTKLPAPANRPVDFAKDIEPLFQSQCVKCHGPDKRKGGLRLDRKESALQGGDNYAPVIRPGKSAESPLIHFVAGLVPDMQMPQKGDPLTADQIALLRAWIDQDRKSVV